MIDVLQIKKIREETNAGIADIKEALEEAGGHEKKAKEILTEKGLAKAAKKASRETKAGVVGSYIHATQTSGAIVILSCETDFVARHEEFNKLAHEIAMQICAMNPKNEKELLGQFWIKDESKTIDALIKESIVKFGENIKIEEFKRLAIK